MDRRLAFGADCRFCGGIPIALATSMRKLVSSPIEAGRIAHAIHLIRGHRVILDADLAALYGVDTKALVRAMKRNRRRFPQDFMIELSAVEHANLRYQFGTSSSWGGRRVPPYAFTEQGVAMLSGVLRSPRAIAVNIEIMRAFVELRRTLETTAGLARKLEVLERRYDGQFTDVFEAIRQLMRPAKATTKRIGYGR